MAALVGVAVAWPIRYFVVDRKPSYTEAPAPKDFHEGSKKIPFGIPPSAAIPPPAPFSPQPPAQSTAVTPAPQPLHVIGYIVKGRRFNALLSDGRTVTERDGLVSRIERNGIAMKDGQWLPILRNVDVRSPQRDAPAPLHSAEGVGLNAVRSQAVGSSTATGTAGVGVPQI